MECNIKCVKLKKVLANGVYPKREHNVRFFYHRTDGCYYMYDEKGCETNLTTCGSIIPLDRELIVGKESLDGDTLVHIGLKASYAHPGRGIMHDGCHCHDTYISAWTYLDDIREWLHDRGITYDNYYVALQPAPIEGGNVGCIGSKVIENPNDNGYKYQFVAGSLVQLIAEPKEGYHFIGWKEYETNEILSINPNWEFHIKRDMNLLGVFSKDKEPEPPVKNKYNLNVIVNPSDGAVISGAGVYEEGDVAIIEILPNQHFTITSVSSNVGELTKISDTKYQIIMNQHVTVTINLIKQFTFNIASAGNGRVRYRYTNEEAPNKEWSDLTQGHTITAPDHSMIQIDCQADEGYHFNYWTNPSGDRFEEAINNLEIDERISNVTYTCYFEKDAPKVYDITLNCDEGGTVSYKIGNGSYSDEAAGHQFSVTEGETYTVKCTPKTGYAFKSWTNIQDKTVNPSSETATVSKTIMATTVATPKYTITLNTTPANSGEVAYDDSSYEATKSISRLEANTQMTIKARPRTGNEFVKWDDGNTNAERSITVTTNKTYVAEFRKKTYNVTASVNGNTGASISINKTSPVEHGTIVTFNWTLSANYRFNKLVVNGLTITEVSNNSYSMEITANTNAVLYVDYVQPTNTVTIQTESGTKGKVGFDSSANKDSDSKSVNQGSSVTVYAKANTGHDFAGWYNGSSKVSSSTNYTFDVNSNITLVAKFTVKTFNITISASYLEQGNKIKVDSSEWLGLYNKQVNYGTSVTIDAQAADGYTFAGWYNGTTKVSDNQRYTFVVTSDLQYNAKFTENPYLEISDDTHSNLDGQTITFPAEGGTHVVHVRSNVDWKIE